MILIHESNADWPFLASQMRQISFLDNIGFLRSFAKHGNAGASNSCISIFCSAALFELRHNLIIHVVR